MLSIIHKADESSLAKIREEMAVRKTVFSQKTNGADIRLWQQLKRRLEPDNPLADDVGLLQR